MRKSLWIMLAVLFVALSAPNAQADSFTYTYTDTARGISWTTAAIPAVTMQTTVPAATLTAASNTGEFAGCMLNSVILAIFGSGDTGLIFTGCVPGTVTVDLPNGFPPLSFYSIPGTYIGGVGETLVVTPVPEPSSVALMLLGLGLVLLLRKRNSRGHQLAT